jgi:protein-S-isoprenylcysteine O-methyltransferase Ste14
MLNFKDTPLDQPVAKGIYKLSRHPQIVSLLFLFLGICVAIGSWLAVFALLLSKLLQHFGILAEEEICLRQYGEPYRIYLKQIPRYFLFF